MLGCDFIVEYKGVDNRVVDALSRKEEAEKNDPIYLVLISVPTLELLNQIKDYYDSDLVHTSCCWMLKKGRLILRYH